ncbi:hypothetical protein BH11MYX2_BH11MYX2_29380 [soil metagenome]
MTARLLPLLLVAMTGVVRAQNAPTADDNVLEAQKFNPAQCVQSSAPKPAAPTGGVAPPPVTWNDFEVSGVLKEPAATVRALFAPTLNRHRALTEDARDDIKRIAESFGYHLVGLGTRETSSGTHAIVQLSPLPIVRRIKVKTDQGFGDALSQPLYQDKLRQRLRTRIGGYLPWHPTDRACSRYEETQNLEEYLRDEGFIDAQVTIREEVAGDEVTLNIDAKLKEPYETGAINFSREPNEVDEDKLRSFFRHPAHCLLGESNVTCWGIKRFTRAQHQMDIQRVVEEYQAHGYPSVRVRTDYDPATSPNRRSHKINIKVSIDQRRKFDHVYEGNEGVAKIDELDGQLTFSAAASADDVEASSSAAAIAGFLQTKEYFDARVTWTRERLDLFDRIVFRIDAGNKRQVNKLEIVGNRYLTLSQLGDVLGTAEATRTKNIFGRTTAPTTARIDADREGLLALYHREGFRDAKVSVAVATDPSALDNPSMAAGMLLAEHGTNLYIRFTIDEGLPTMLPQIEVNLGDQGEQSVTPEQRLLCATVLRELAAIYKRPELGVQAAPDRCVATSSTLRYQERIALDTRDKLKDRLYSIGRPRAKVTYEAIPYGDHRILTRYKLTDIQPLTIGKVVVRGNFKTDRGTILSELRFVEGAPLTKETLADGARRLRNTGLFESVNVAMPDLDTASSGAVNAVVEIAERHDNKLRVDLEAGFSSFNGLFGRVVPSFKNLFGRGISLDLSGTLGVKPKKKLLSGNYDLQQLAAEVTLRFPEFLSRRYINPPAPLTFATEINAFHRIQDTDRFGHLITDGFTVAFSHTQPRLRTETHDARAITYGIHYDFRRRERLVDVLRPLGADEDQSQVPISTLIGSVGVSFEWEQRVDRNGNLQPLLPNHGFRWQAQASLAAPELFGQDTFAKLSGVVSKFFGIGDNLVIRGDLRYDQGFPLRGAVLLPETERYFAGGDSTVRGYEDDRLKTEIVAVPVPPFYDSTQLRILPAGGNIRMLGSLDAQLQLWSSPIGYIASGVFFDAGMISNTWGTVDQNDIRPATGAGLRWLTPAGAAALEWAVPLNPQIGDNHRGRMNFSFATRDQF